MSQGVQPNPAQVPTLTEVIELLSPTPVRETGLNDLPRPAAPQQGTAAATPIVTPGLPTGQPQEVWAPMTTVVVPTLDNVVHPAVMALADLPVLDAVVPEPAVVTPVASPVSSSAPLTARAAVAEARPHEPVLPEISEAQLAQRVLADVQRQIDGMLDFRLKEAIGPILARHSEALVRELREELTRTMRDVVTRSVAQEMAKLRQR